MEWHSISVLSVILNTPNFSDSNNRIAPVAQLDRAPGYGPGGWGFESSQAYTSTFHYLPAPPEYRGAGGRGASFHILLSITMVGMFPFYLLTFFIHLIIQYFNSIANSLKITNGIFHN